MSWPNFEALKRIIGKSVFEVLIFLACMFVCAYDFVIVDSGVVLI
jgi:hypothetical protein